MNNHTKALMLGLSFSLLTACGGGSGTGQMTVRLTDAPVDSAEEVVVEFAGIELHQGGATPQRFIFDTPQQIDLLELTGGDNKILLDTVTIPAGRYQQLRLLVNTDEVRTEKSFIKFKDGGTHPLHVPSGELKLVSGFTVPEDGFADFTIDFDLRKSVTEPGKSGKPYILRPTLRLVETNLAGAIEGVISASQAAAGGCVPDSIDPVVYIYPGAGVTPDDIGSTTEPVSSASATPNDQGDYVYHAAFLPAGDYTVAFTCMAAADDPATDDDIVFSTPVDVTVTTGNTSNVDFP
jgi:hypothetical protein